MGGGNLKNKNAFTLIELLAIIVILAIIAVITVPIILNIIENSRMGAAKDSAYGYKDAINKWYVSKLSEDSQYQLADSYTISSDGKLGNIEIPLSGDKPSGGYLNYSNNTLTSGCLIINEYEVRYEDGKFTSNGKGNCSSNSSDVALSCGTNEFLSEDYNYNYRVTDVNACETFYSEWKGCGTDEECLEIVSDICAGKEVGDGFSLNVSIKDGYIDEADVKDFVSKEVSAVYTFCKPKCYDVDVLDDGNIAITKYLCGAEYNEETETYNTEGKELDVNIPSQLTGINGNLTVTTIKNNAFSGAQLNSIIIPSTIVYIGDEAFGSNKLESIELPNTLSHVGDDILRDNNSLTEIRVGERVFNLETQFDTCLGTVSVNGCNIAKSEISEINEFTYVYKFSNKYLRINNSNEMQW